MSTTPPPNTAPRAPRILLWAIVGGIVGWAVGWFGFAMHCAVFVPGPIPMRADGLDQNVRVTAHTQLYGHTIREETGPFGEVFPAANRRANLLAWPVLAASIVAGALIGARLGSRARRLPGAKPQTE